MAIALDNFVSHNETGTIGQGSKQLDELLAEPNDSDENEDVNVEDMGEVRRRLRLRRRRFFVAANIATIPPSIPLEVDAE